MSVALADVVAAARDPSTKNDLRLLRSELSGNDRFVLSVQSDLARGFEGDDRMQGRAGNDRLYGGSGADIVWGHDDSDKLFGEAGNDVLRGGQGADALFGGEGRDTLVGGSGTDRLYGGADAVADVFDFNHRSDSPSRAAASVDQVFGFKSGVDRIDLRDIDARAGTAERNEEFRYTGDEAGSHSVWWNFGHTATGTGVLVRADVTGDGSADFEVWLSGTRSLIADDFML
jgi:hypothetical protein